MRKIVAVLLLLGIGAWAAWMWSQLGHLGTPPDPNDPREAGVLAPDVLRQNLKGASDALLQRVQHGEITDDQFKDLMAKAANDLLSQVDISRIPAKKAWEYGEIFITARRWQDARRAFELAVKVAKDENRRVNDSLRLARSLAELGDVQGAIRTVRSVMNTPDAAAAPILPAVLLEIVPASAGKGHEAALASLLEGAIACEQRTIVDPSTDPGKDFLMARPFHLRNAWAKVVELYDAAGDAKAAAAARDKADATLRTQAGA